MLRTSTGTALRRAAASAASSSSSSGGRRPLPGAASSSSSSSLRPLYAGCGDLCDGDGRGGGGGRCGGGRDLPGAILLSRRGMATGAAGAGAGAGAGGGWRSWLRRKPAEEDAGTGTGTGSASGGGGGGEAGSSTTTTTSSSFSSPAPFDDSTTSFSTSATAVPGTAVPPADAAASEAAAAAVAAAADPLEASSSAASSAAEGLALEALPWEPFTTKWAYYGPELAITAINHLQQLTGLPYAGVIAGTTAAIRVAAFPLFVMAQRNASRMAHVKPELDQLKAQLERVQGTPDLQTQQRHMERTRALFRKYDVNPLRSLLVPFVQMPVFMSMFFGLKWMPNYFPTELATGGALWFPDLTLADPYHIMPLACAGLFVGMLEVGKEQMMAGNAQTGPAMLNAFRFMGVVMVGATWDFSSAIFCYWTTNNLVSVGQSVLFRDPAMRRRLGIWDPPPPVPGQGDKGIMESMKAAFEKSDAEKTADRIRLHNEAIDRQRERKRLGREAEGGGRREGGGGGGRETGKKRGGKRKKYRR